MCISSLTCTLSLTNIGYVGVAVVSGWLCINGRLSIGMIQSFIQYLRQFSQPINQVSNIANIMQATMAAAQRVFEFLDAEEEVPEAEKPQFPEIREGNVDFSHVRFGYTEDRTLIHDLDLHVHAGDKIAIVGPTGAGNTVWKEGDDYRRIPDPLRWNPDEPSGRGAVYGFWPAQRSGGCGQFCPGPVSG